jgi:hypothetical protein
MRALFCIDPGASTGVAWGIVNERHKGFAYEAVAKRLESDSMTLTGPEHEQIRELYRLWSYFKRRSVTYNQMEPEWVDLVIEDFVLFPGEKPGKDTTIAERIAWGFEGYRMAMFDRHRPHADPPLRHMSPAIWQKSGAAHRFANQEILKMASAWIRGKEHERSAWAHMILRVNILMDRNIQDVH